MPRQVVGQPRVHGEAAAHLVVVIQPIVSTPCARGSRSDCGPRRLRLASASRVVGIWLRTPRQRRSWTRPQYVRSANLSTDLVETASTRALYSAGRGDSRSCVSNRFDGFRCRPRPTRMTMTRDREFEHDGHDEPLSVPVRSVPARAAREIEAESVAYVVANRHEVESKSEAYLSSFLNSNSSVERVDVHQVMRAAGQVEAMPGLETRSEFGTPAPRRARRRGR